MNEKILLIMRHSEASEPYGAQTDLSRELTAKGQADAYKAGQFLSLSDTMPQIIVCSSAKRAWQTAELLSSQLGYPKDKIVSQDQLYQASMGTLITLIHQLPNSIDVALIIAHNPTLTYFAEYLTQENHHLQPASCLCIKFVTSNWNLITKGQGVIHWLKESW